MPNLTSVGITAGIPTSGTGTVSTIDNFLGTAGSGSTNVLTVQGNASGTPIPVSGTVTATTGGLTDTQLRATAVPVSGTVTVTSVTANAGTNLNTSALALESGGHLASIDTNVGAKADTAVTDPTLSGSEIALLKGIISTLNTDAVTLGQTTKSNSVPVTMASDQGATAVTGTFWQTTQPVSGTVTANAGTNLNTSNLALETGGNLAAINSVLQFPVAVTGTTTPIRIVERPSPVTSVGGQNGNASGSITTGGTSQLGSNFDLTTAFLILQNPSSETLPLYYSFVGLASTSGTCPELAPGQALILDGTYFPSGASGVQSVHVNATTTGHKYVCHVMGVS